MKFSVRRGFCRVHGLPIRRDKSSGTNRLDKECLRSPLFCDPYEHNNTPAADI